MTIIAEKIALISDCVVFPGEHKAISAIHETEHMAILELGLTRLPSTLN